MRIIEQRFADEFQATLFDEYNQTLDSFEAEGGYQFLQKREEFLHVFGLENVLDRQVKTLSGGEQQYLRLAAVIFSKASLLVLDEPFSFLDEGKRLWLLSYIREVKKTVILISHDNSLLSEFATDVINIHNWKVKKYTVRYDTFLTQRDNEDTRYEQLNQTADQQIEQKEASIVKRKQWMKKAYDKHKHAVIIHRLERDIEKIQKQKYAVKEIKDFSVSQMVRDYNLTEGLLIQVKEVSKCFGERCLFDRVSLSVYSNKHYYIWGENGAGKTTLLSIIMKNIDPSQGEVIYRRKIIFSSLEQMQNKLDRKMSCLEMMEKVANCSLEDCIAKYSSLFDKDFWNKKLWILSGGELRKFMIFISLLHEFDVLVLDEPTTFIDMQTRSNIIQMLNACSKCVIVVTHDPELFDQAAGVKLLLQDGMLEKMQ